jgi:hypothetical protein
MARKKLAETKTKSKKQTSEKKLAKPKEKPAKQAKSKTKKTKRNELAGDDAGIVIIDDDLTVDKEAENEERRAYLEEARSQEAFD